jgi:hypothetical protein
MSDDRLFEPINQPASVRIIADHLLPGFAPRYNVIDATSNSIRSRRYVSEG